MEEKKNDLFTKLKETCEACTKKVEETINKENLNKMTNQIEGFIKDTSNKVNDSFDNVNVENALHLALKAPGAVVNREAFLKEQFEKDFSEEIIAMAIEKSPAFALIPQEKIDEAAKNSVDFESEQVTWISASTSVLGGSVIAAGIDLVQYFIGILRIEQKLAYLYGFKEMNLKTAEVDKEAMRQLMVLMGIMFDVKGADEELQKMTKEEEMEINAKATVYPFVKEVIQYISIKLTKQVFADSVVSTVPLVGAVASGAITYVTYKPCANRLQKALQELKLNQPITE